MLENFETKFIQPPPQQEGKKNPEVPPVRTENPKKPPPFETKFMQPPPQQEGKKNPEVPPVRTENPKNIEPAPKVVPKSETHIEERPTLDELRGDEVNEVGEYIEVTPKQEKKFKEGIEQLSVVLEHAPFLWFLDGAANISLYKDKQIRDHKDLDISIFQEDLPKLYELLARQGFGIFVNYDENGKRLMRELTMKEVEELATAPPEKLNLDLSICKIGPDGKIQRKTKNLFNFVDLHIHGKDAEGNTIISYNGIPVPKEFFEPIKKVLSNGKEINLSQPGIVAYHKFHSSRTYDWEDLKRLRPYLQERDFQMLRESFEKEFEKTKKMVIEKLPELWNLLTPILKLSKSTHDQKVIQKIISGKLWEHPYLQKLRSDQKVSEFVSSISQYVSENPSITFEDFLNQSFAILKPREWLEQKLKVIDQLEKS